MGETFKFTTQNVKECTNNKAITNGTTDGQIWGRIAIIGFENLFPNSFLKVHFVCLLRFGLGDTFVWDEAFGVCVIYK